LSSSKSPQVLKKRHQLKEQLVYQFSRALSTRTVLFHAAVAERMGLSQGDHKALDLIYEAEQKNALMTAGQLAEATGLTTGAITGLVDRLEKAKLVHRTPDPQDRRKVVLAPTHARDDELFALLSPIGKRAMNLSERYTDAELEIIMDYVARTIELTVEETQRLRDPNVIDG
jgi:DNA-binding MarR family transcriptional regulator